MSLIDIKWMENINQFKKVFLINNIFNKTPFELIKKIFTYIFYCKRCNKNHSEKSIKKNNDSLYKIVHSLPRYILQKYLTDINNFNHCRKEIFLKIYDNNVFEKLNEISKFEYSYIIVQRNIFNYYNVYKNYK